MILAIGLLVLLVLAGGGYYLYIAKIEPMIVNNRSQEYANEIDSHVRTLVRIAEKAQIYDSVDKKIAEDFQNEYDALTLELFEYKEYNKQNLIDSKYSNITGNNDEYITAMEEFLTNGLNPMNDYFKIFTLEAQDTY